MADGLYLIGDPAGPELHTHQAHYQGQLAVRMALGDSVTPDYRALPRATYTDPELASVGVTLDEAIALGLDAFELVADFAMTAKGFSVEATFGHITIVVDRSTRQLVGAAMAVPDASAAIHECVLAIKARVPIEVLADTIHAFPSTSTDPEWPVRRGCTGTRAGSPDQGVTCRFDVGQVGQRAGSSGSTRTSARSTAATGPPSAIRTVTTGDRR